MAYTGVSITDYLKSVGQASDFASRQKLAQQYGIQNYTGTAQQNTQLLSLVKSGTPLNTGNVYAQQQDAIRTQIQEIQTQLKTAQNKVAAMQKYGIKDDSQLTQDTNGNWVPIENPPQQEQPMPDEFQKYLDEAQAYYEPAKQTEMSELEQSVTTEKQRLAQDWQQYINDINTGKIRAGSDYQTQLQRQLEQKSQYLQQQEFNIKQNMNTLNRNWMSRGGLFSGARLEAGANYMTQEDMAKNQFLSGVNYNVAQLGTTQQRAMEDYATAQTKGETAYNRGVEDVGLQRIKDIRSLTEKYNTAISDYAGQNAYYDTRKSVYGY